MLKGVDVVGIGISGSGPALKVNLRTGPKGPEFVAEDD